MNILREIGIGACICVVVACGSKSTEVKGDVRFERIPSTTSGISFSNDIANDDEMNIFNYRNFYNGGGVAMGDVNNDGLVDLYFTKNQGQNKLYLNKGDLTFEDISEAAGVTGTRTWSTGVVMVDINSDGLLDIYVCNAGYIKGEDQENELFINNGDLTFTEQASEYGLNESGYTTHAAFFDFDGDADLDVYILNNSFMPVNTLNYSNKRELKAADWPVKDFLKGGGDKLFRNDNGKYVEVTEEAGIYSSLIGFGLGVTVGDVNGDYLPDMYISNDFFERDYLYINQGDGTFKEDIKNRIDHLSMFSMGADMADINNDGYPEIFVTDMLPDTDERLKTTSSFETYSVYELKLKRDFYHQFMQNTLQLNNGDNTFKEISYHSGVAASDWSWGALMFDMDNDGYRDIYICNGINQDVTDQDFINFFANEIIQKMALTGKKEELQEVLKNMPSTPIPNKAFRNEGASLQFEDIGQQWGFTEETFSNGAAYGDLDNDGDLDLVINNVNQEAFLYKNLTRETEDKHYMRIDLIGQAPNTRAIGSHIEVHVGAEVLSTEVIPSRGFQSSVDYRALFGLGSNTQVDSVVIIWPDRSRSVHFPTLIDTAIVITDPQISTIATNKGLIPSGPYLSKADIQLEPHIEDNYVDFYNEGLIIKKISNEGPAVAIGDVNGDGTDDLFIGGARNQSGAIYFQTDSGLESTTQPGLVQTADFEDTAAKFVDIDGDNDLDLYIGSGGNNAAARTRNLQDRIYRNDGNGTFALDAQALPLNGLNTSIILTLDIDGDEDNDIISLSRSIPFNYGPDPRNFVFENDGNGMFKDVTEEIAPELKFSGLITDATLTDLDGDGINEIVVVGEWMSPTIYSVANGKITELNTSLNTLTGWWGAVASSDLDGDGDNDLVLGNIGTNFYLSASESSPLKLWLADFDNNGAVENIITRTVNGKDVPVPMKGELTEQIVSLKKQNLKHSDFATKSIQELFDDEAMSRAVSKNIVTTQSVIAWNEGGSYRVEALPDQIQLSCVCDITCTDINNDNRPDLLIAGNDFGFVPQFGRLDASQGHVLINSGNGKYDMINGGLGIRGQVREMLEVEMNGDTYIMAAVNNEAPVFLKVESEIN